MAARNPRGDHPAVDNPACRPAAIRIQVEDPRAADVAALLMVHSRFARSQTPPEDAHALDGAALIDPLITFFAARRDDQLLAVGAIRELASDHGELKSMHTTVAARRQGIGEAMLTHLISVARSRSYRCLSLETGSHPMFAPARALYAKAGFCETTPFGEYRESTHSTYMALHLTP